MYGEHRKGPYRCKDNGTMRGKFKDQAKGTPISEFVCVCSKMYSYKLAGGEEHKKGKGVKNKVIEKDLMPGFYKDCIALRFWNGSRDGNGARSN